MSESTASPTPSAARIWPQLTFLGLACLLLWPVVFGGRVFVPATLLRYFAPWEQEQKPPWNPLMYDSVGQFYPWRHFAAQELKSGRIPLWNPYQFSGTPFIANSQSAVFYPGNLLYWLLPTAQAAGPNVILHLCLAAWFTYGFLRAYRLSVTSAALGGIVYAFSGWQVSWLALPTFLCTSCWLPLVLLCVKRLAEKPTWPRSLALGAAIGMTLLAGHLQVAFYVILAALAYAIWVALTPEPRQDSTRAVRGPLARRAALFTLSLALGAMLAGPQLLPTFELSRRSHRAAPVNAAGYQSYVAYAVHPASLVTLFAPDFYGNPSDPDNPYMGGSRGGPRGPLYFNYAEGAMYVGIPALLLASFGLFRIKQIGWRRIGFFGLLALLSLAMATGTFVDALFYFYVPGFGQSGSPGRSLVLWSFAMACLAAFGYEKLRCDDATPIKSAALSIASVGTLALFLLFAGPTASLAKDFNLARALPQIPRQAGLFILSAGAIMGLASGKLRCTRYAALPVALAAVDLLAAGSGYNLTAESKDVYPERASLTELKELAGHDRIMPVNRDWSFAGPHAVLPPNGAMVYRLRDVQGYDSLFPGQYKAFMNGLSSPAPDASPPEVGNMVFAKNPTSFLAAEAGVKFVLGRHELPLAGAVPVEDGVYPYKVTGALGRAYADRGNNRSAPVTWMRDEPTRIEIVSDLPTAGAVVLADQTYPGWHATVDGAPTRAYPVLRVFQSYAVGAGRHTVRLKYDPASFRTGVYLALFVTASAAATLTTHRANRLRG